MNIKSMTCTEVGALLKEMGQPAFRAKQVFTWLHKGVTSYDEMTNLPKALREQLALKRREVVRGNLSSRNTLSGFRKLLENRRPQKTEQLNICGNWKTEIAWKPF